MSLLDRIAVNVRYTRSANLERDIDSLPGVESDIPITRSLDTLRRILAGFDAAEAPRAWVGLANRRDDYQEPCRRFFLSNRAPLMTN